jgi:hypothetical protein
MNSKKADSERLWELKEELNNYTTLELFGKAEKNILERSTIAQLDEVKEQIHSKF